MKLKLKSKSHLRPKVFFLAGLWLWCVLWGAQCLYPAGTAGVRIDKWLALGPMTIPDTEANILEDRAEVLKFRFISLSDLRPVRGDQITWGGGKTYRWEVLKDFRLNPVGTQVVYLAAYLETRRWLQTKFFLKEVNYTFTVFLDGRAKKTNKGEGKNENEWHSNLDLTNGKHVLVLKVLLPKGKPFELKPFLEHKKPFERETVRVSLTPYHRLEEKNILNEKNVRGLRVSPDGKYAAVSLSRTLPHSGKRKKWLEILDTRKGKTVFSSENFGEMGDFRWLNDSVRFSYAKEEKGKTSVFVYHLATHTQTPLLEGIKNLSAYWWAPDGSFLFYSVYRKKDGDAGYKYIEKITDKATYSGFVYSLYIFYPPKDGRTGGITHRVVEEDQDFRFDGGESFFNPLVVSPDSRQALFLKYKEDYKNRPYTRVMVYLFDVDTFSLRLLMEGNWINSVGWSPDSTKLLVLGGPSAFDGVGKNLSEPAIPNDYDVQAFLFDLGTRRVTPISRDFAPSIESAFWSPRDRNIYFRVTDRSFVGLYRYSPGRGKYRELKTGSEYVGTIDFSRSAKTAVFWGSGAAEPFRLYKVNLSSGSASLLKDYNRESFRYVQLGGVENWDFTTPEGKTIMGRLYFPPDFDASRKYPCIVYYYGGASAVTRDFGGRYPKNWYAANGYIVYVLQPSGAPGFGQDFSARHVNDWGKLTSGEIIAGIKALVEAKPYIDGTKIGAMGASYGGFLTQYLAAHTDIVAAFVSHAGISALSSYWGEGDWGYLYSGIATAGSFPWNRKDIYVGHSPLYMADRIDKPLLLLHGDRDNNVPPGESYQMFTALKLLGKEVALVTFKDQRHRILEYRKRLQWMRTIIAWFDKWLKGQPQEWEFMYKPKKN